MSTIVHTITPRSNFLRSTSVDEFHAQMFHGLAEREGVEFHHDRTGWASYGDPVALTISRTERFVPTISCPSSQLVVAESLRAHLAALSNIRLWPVRFKRLVDVEVVKGDFAPAMQWVGIDPAELLRTQPH